VLVSSVNVSIDVCGTLESKRGTVLVNADLLKDFARQVDVASATLKSTDAALKSASAAADGLPGSETQWIMRQVGDHMSLVVDNIASQVTNMGTMVRGAGDRYEVDDDTLAGDFKRLF
jgi:hypothetical protein